MDILKSLKMGTAPPGIYEPVTCMIEYDLDQVEGMSEEGLPISRY